MMRFRHLSPLLSLSRASNGLLRHQRHRNATVPLLRSFCASSSTSHHVTRENRSEQHNQLVTLVHQSIDARDARTAAMYFQQLPTDCIEIHLTMTQRLVILMAKQTKSLQETHECIQLLRTIYRIMAEPDDYTHLASIYVIDACIRFQLLDPALEIVENAMASGVCLDLPAYEAIVVALVQANHLDQATHVLKQLMAHQTNLLTPTEELFRPVLFALKEAQAYDQLVDLIEVGRSHGIPFTYTKTYGKLMDGIEIDSRDMDGPLYRLLNYFDEAMVLENPLGLDFEEDDDDDEEDSKTKT